VTDDAVTYTVAQYARNRPGLDPVSRNALNAAAFQPTPEPDDDYPPDDDLGEEDTHPL
jgi:hypothetical protein